MQLQEPRRACGTLAWPRRPPLIRINVHQAEVRYPRFVEAWNDDEATMEAVVYFILWAGLFFVMMRYGCGAHVMGHGHKHDGSSAARTMPVLTAASLPRQSTLIPCAAWS